MEVGKDWSSRRRLGPFSPVSGAEGLDAKSQEERLVLDRHRHSCTWQQKARFVGSCIWGSGDGRCTWMSFAIFSVRQEANSLKVSREKK